MSGLVFRPPGPLGEMVWVEQRGDCVHLVFTAPTEDAADALIDQLLRQLRAGRIEFSVYEPPSNGKE